MEICFLNKNGAEESTQKENTNMAEKTSRVLTVLHAAAAAEALTTNAPMSWEDIH